MNSYRAYLWVVTGATVGWAVAWVIPGLDPGVGLGSGLAVGLAISSGKGNLAGRCYRASSTRTSRNQPQGH
jgi:hypothetical protein